MKQKTCCFDSFIDNFYWESQMYHIKHCFSYFGMPVSQTPHDWFHSQQQQHTP